MAKGKAKAKGTPVATQRMPYEGLTRVKIKETVTSCKGDLEGLHEVRTGMPMLGPWLVPCCAWSVLCLVRALGRPCMLAMPAGTGATLRACHACRAGPIIPVL